MGKINLSSWATVEINGGLVTFYYLWPAWVEEIITREVIQMSRRIGDVVTERMQMEGEVIRVRELVGQTFTITAVQEWKGKDGAYMAVQIERANGKRQYFFSSHVVIMRKLQEAADVIAREPLEAEIVQVEADNPTGYFFDIR